MAATVVEQPLTNPAALIAAIEDIEPLAPKISDLKAETTRREGDILAKILARVTPMVPIIGRQGESYYRRDIIILKKCDHAAWFYSEQSLVLYENGELFRIHRFGDQGDKGFHCPGWERIEEIQLTVESAVLAFGLSEIAGGLIRVLQDAESTIIQWDDLRAQIDALVTVLEALNRPLAGREI
jgi:hypothetical protein